MESTAPNRRQQIAALLKRYWGFDTFRPVQEQVILSVLAGRDTLALMPTGGGKSLTYQIPGLASEGVCIVVTPLIALMKDQVDRLRKLGIRALAIHSGLSARQIDIDLDNCVYGDVKFLYVAPERLASEAFRLRVQRMNVSLLAVDEAHCISQWGYDFRPSYLRIAELRERIPGVPVLALTASATPRVADDIMEKLHFTEPHLLRSDFSRPNLSYAVRHTDDKNEQLLRIIRNVGGSGIVYVRTREGAEQVAAFLRDEGISAEYYHGGLGHAERSMRQDAWISGRTPVMVATNAFGMGIDKPDVRYVVHYTMCDSLESYYQEAGRAGRDGRRSYAVLLISSDDAGRIAKRFEADYPPLEKIRSIYEKICSYLQIAIGDGAQSSFLFNLRDFCTREHLYTGLVQNALKILSQNGYMTLLDEAANPARILFCVSRDDLYRLRVIRDDLDPKTPIYLKYKTHADNDSMYNTPNCWAIYCCGKVFRYLLDNGGLEEMEKRNIAKAKVIYDFLDSSKLFKGAVVPEDRSLMNIPFVTGDKDLDAAVVAASKEAGFDNLKGHKSVGGLRASVYNAMPIEGAEALVEFLKKFEAEHK